MKTKMWDFINYVFDAETILARILIVIFIPFIIVAGSVFFVTIAVGTVIFDPICRVLTGKTPCSSIFDNYIN